MATITPPPGRAQDMADYQRRVRSPLARLRGAIRTYVSLEGALLLVLYLALWFWIGLALDYGVFKLTAALGMPPFDWVQAWPWAVRLVLLVAVAGAIAAAVFLLVFGRMWREFRDPALALVLERRFPELLGDRLITAVELSDLKEAERQGYSPAMVMETVHEASQRVEKVPVQKAFDWRRLIRRGVLAAVLTLGLYLVVGGVTLAVDMARHAHAGRTGFGRFNEVAGIWFERNILLKNTIWPRQAQLVFVNVPEDGLKVGEGNPVPSVRLRALEYVIADPKTPEGWRALTWNDLTARPELAGGIVPAAPFSAAPRDAGAGLTVDEAALALRKFDVRAAGPGESGRWLLAVAGGAWRPLRWADLKPEKLDGLPVPKTLPTWEGRPADSELTLEAVATAATAAGPGGPAEFKDVDAIAQHLDRLAAVHDVIDRVNARAALPEMSRTMRRLDVPEKIFLSGYGEKSSLQQSLDRGSDNEYTADFKNLDESIGFGVQADDYYTPRRTITLVPPPTLDRLDVAEERPAYLYYRPDDATTLGWLRGKKQPFAVHNVHQTGTESERIDVPAGTDLTLTAHVTKDLAEVFLKAKNPQDLRELRVRDADAAKLKAAGLQVEPAAGDSSSVVVRPARDGDALRMPVAIGADRRGFRIQLPDVRRDMALVLEFTDADGVKGRREVRVQAQVDTAPDLKEVTIPSLRNGTSLSAKGEKKAFYMVTAQARIPVSARITDDHALGEVLYRYTLTAPTGTAADVPDAAKGAGSAYAPPRFAEVVREARDQTPSETVKGLLAQPQEPPFRQLVRDVQVQPDAWGDVQRDPLGYDFPLWNQKVALDDNHPFYRMDFWLEAADTDADDQAGPDGAPLPHVSKSKETFTFLIVRENVLMAEIGKDEAKQYGSLHKRFQDLGRLVMDKRDFDALTASEREPGKDRRDDLADETATLTLALAKVNDPDVKTSDLLQQSVRAGNVIEALEKSLAETRVAVDKYDKLLREEQLNVVNKDVIDYTQKNILEKLQDLLAANGDFAQAQDGIAKFRKALDDKAASDKDHVDAARAAGKDLQPKMTTLMKDLYAVLESMRGRENLQSLKDRLTGIDTGVQQLKNDTDAIFKYLQGKIFDP